MVLSSARTCSEWTWSLNGNLSEADERIIAELAASVRLELFVQPLPPFPYRG